MAIGITIKQIVTVINNPSTNNNDHNYLTKVRVIQSKPILATFTILIAVAVAAAAAGVVLVVQSL